MKYYKENKDPFLEYKITNRNLAKSINQNTIVFQY